MAKINGTNASESITGTGGNDKIRGLEGSDTLIGRNGNDQLLGGAGDDALIGGNGGDLLQGGFGNDALDGGRGVDTLIGGAGDDAFQWSLDVRGSSLGHAFDVVADFEGAGAEGGDAIALSGIDPDGAVFNGQVSLNDPIAGGGNGLTDIAYGIAFGDTFLLVDANDDGKLSNDDLVVRFVGTQDLTEADFSGVTFVDANAQVVDPTAFDFV